MVEVEGAHAERELGAALHAVGALLGIPITTSDRDEWQLDAQGLRVGLGWYGARGHSQSEAIALAALHLWEGPRERIAAPERARRALGLERARADLVPLTSAIRRVQAAFELLRAMPGLRAPLQAAVYRTLPAELSTQQRHLQWVTLVLAQLTPLADRLRIDDPDVAREWQQLGAIGGAETDALRRVLMPDPTFTPLRRFERALALLLPGYERLSRLDAASAPTVLGGSDRAELSLEAEAPLGSDDFSLGDEDQAAASSDDGDEAAADPSAPELDQLTASANEDFVQQVLATPIPDASSVVAASAELDEVAESDRAELGEAGAAAAGNAAATVLADYRERSAELAPEIDRIRALFARIIGERVAMRRSQSRRAFADGEQLATDMFASIIAEAVSGVRAPQAFRRRVLTPTLTSDAGSTDYVLMVDASASMTGPASQAAADAMIILLEGLAAVERDIAHAEQRAGISLELDIRSSLIVFDAEATVLKPLSRGLDDEARRRIHAETREPGGSTNDAAALAAAAEQLGISRSGALARPSPAVSATAATPSLVIGNSNNQGEKVSGPVLGGTAALVIGNSNNQAAGRGTGEATRTRIVILVSDGGTNDAAAAHRELQRLRSAGVGIYGIGVGTDDLAKRYAPDGIVLNDPRELPRLLERLLAEHLDAIG